MNSLIRQRIIDVLVDGEVKPRLEAEASQHSQRIISESHQWLKRCPDHPILNITQATLSVILYVASVDVIEKTVDCEVSAKSIVQRRADVLNIFKSTMVGILD